MIFVIHSLVPF